MNEVPDQATAVAVVVAIGAFLWSMKKFWAKGLGALCFASAVAMAYQDPLLLAILIGLGLAFVSFKLWRLSVKARKKSAKKQQQNAGGVTINNHHHYH